MDELERMAFIIRSTMTAVLTLPTANTLTKNEPNKISIGDCYNGFRNFKNPDKENELSATFEDVEQLFYRQRYRDFVTGQTKEM